MHQACTATLTQHERKKAGITSGVQFTFWLILTLCDVIPFYTFIMEEVRHYYRGSDVREMDGDRSGRYIPKTEISMFSDRGMMKVQIVRHRYNSVACL